MEDKRELKDNEWWIFEKNEVYTKVKEAMKRQYCEVCKEEHFRVDLCQKESTVYRIIKPCPLPD